MTINHIEYKNYVTGLLKNEIKSGPKDKRLYYLVGKLISELGEVIGEIWKRDFHNKNVLSELIVSELGDCMWYWYNLVDCFTTEEQNKTFIKVDQYLNQDHTDKINIHKSAMRLTSIVGDMAESINTNGEFFLEHLDRFMIHFIPMIKTMGYDYYNILEINKKKLLKRHGNKYNSLYYNSV